MLPFRNQLRFRSKLPGHHHRRSHRLQKTSLLHSHRILLAAPQAAMAYNLVKVRCYNKQEKSNSQE